MQIGIIGYGIMGQTRLRTLAQVAEHVGMELEVKKICEVNEDNRNKIPRNIEVCETASQIIEDPNLDAVFVCTPNFLTKDYVVACLQAGKHVFSEKPPGRNAAEIQEMRDAEIASGKKLMFGFNHRHHDSMLYAKKVIDSGEFGKIIWMRGRYGKTVNENYKNTWRAQRKYSGGGIFLDQGIHMLDLFLMMCGDFDEVKADVSSLFWDLDVEDNVFAIFKNKKGQVASLHSTMTQWRHLFSFEIFMEKGHIVINGLLTNSGSYGAEKLSIATNFNKDNATWNQEETYTYKVNNSWKNEMDIFFESVRDDKPVPMGNSEDALKLMKLVDKVYEVGS